MRRDQKKTDEAVLAARQSLLEQLQTGKRPFANLRAWMFIPAVPSRTIEASPAMLRVHEGPWCGDRWR